MQDLHKANLQNSAVFNQISTFVISIKHLGPVVQSIVSLMSLLVVNLYWGFTAQSTQWGHVERVQFT